MKQFSYFKQKGDAYIFTTSVGLILTLFMVVLMLTVILAKGLGFFWPANLKLVEMENNKRYLGEQYESETVHATNAAEQPVAQKQIQLKIGNRDIYGRDFIWLKTDEIIKTQRPAFATVFEREEYGNFYGFIKTLHVGSEEFSRASMDEKELFRKTQKAHNLARENLAKSQEVEEEINSLLLPLTNLHREISLFEISAAAQTSAGQQKLQDLQDKADRLESAMAGQYQDLSNKLQRLREINRSIYLDVRTAGDLQHNIQLDNVVRAFQPNRMNTAQKSWLYVKKIWEFVAAEPRESNTEGGVFPAIFGTVMMVVIMSIAVVPFGVMAAIYLNEYARQGTVVRLIRLSVNNLAGVPSIVFGVFGLGFFIYMIGGSIDQLFFSAKLPEPTFGTGGILWASLTLALLTVPVVVVATEEGLLAVPLANKEGALALGSTRWQMVRRIVLPNAMPGILTGLILAISRGAGEVAPLMITGVVKLAPALPIDGSFPFLHLDRKFMHLGFHIYDVGFQSPNVEAAKPMVYTTALLLILIVVLLNLLAIFMRNRLRKKYKSATF